MRRTGASRCRCRIHGRYSRTPDAFRFHGYAPHYVEGHEPAAMLYAPLRLYIYADDSGQGVLVMDQPSTLFGSLGNLDVAAVGRELDDKVAGVLAALGVDVPPSLAGSPRHAKTN